MDYPTPRLMDFHFAKHLSPLVLASEREMSFDCAATSISRWALWLPCQWPALHRVACWGAATEWGAWLRGCGRVPGSYSRHPQGFPSLPALCRGLLLRRASCSLAGAPPQECLPQIACNRGKHFWVLSMCQTWFYITYHLSVFHPHNSPMR